MPRVVILLAIVSYCSAQKTGGTCLGVLTTPCSSDTQCLSGLEVCSNQGCCLKTAVYPDLSSAACGDAQGPAICQSYASIIGFCTNVQYSMVIKKQYCGTTCKLC